ncbi:negative cofactor 2 transcription regulator complex subunit ncb2 [Hypoxylon texense]
MEPISAIASFIAIGQALAAAPKIIDALSSLVKVRQEVIELLNEIEWLDNFGRHIRESTKTLPNDDSTMEFSIQQRYQLQSVASDLESIVSQLGELAQKFQRGTKAQQGATTQQGAMTQQGTKEDGQLKIDRLSWLFKRGKVASLSKRAKKNRERLQEIFNCNTFFASMCGERQPLEIPLILY